MAGNDGTAGRGIVLITGCSSGIGLATAVAFARQGWVVIASVRDMARSDRLRAALVSSGASAEIVELDVTDEASITEAIATIIERHGGIDVVVSNAGVGVDGTTEELSVDDFRASLEVNLLGAVRLLHAVLPVMRAAGAGRLIAVSSVAGVIGQPFNDAYCAAKFALEGLFESLHPVLAGHGIFVSVIEPGPVTGEFVDKSARPSPTASAKGPYTTQRARFAEVQVGAYDTAQSPAEIAEAIVTVAAAESPPPRIQTSEAVSRLVGVKLHDRSGERIAALTRRWV
jgi:NAD(P)-dependent dehydrogenase (short-subunit alcohol dehydrogenase family)